MLLIFVVLFTFAYMLLRKLNRNPGCIIVAKGPTAKKLKKKDYPNTVLIGVKQAFLLIDEPDFVLMNDIEGLNDLEKGDLAHVKCFLIPEYVHKGFKPHEHGKRDFIHKLKELGYTGKVQTYNLKQPPGCKKNDQVVTLSGHCVTSTHTALAYMSQVYGIKTFHTYGFLIEGQTGYRGDFYNSNKKEQNVKRQYDRFYNMHLNSFNHLKDSLKLTVSRF